MMPSHGQNVTSTSSEIAERPEALGRSGGDVGSCHIDPSGSLEHAPRARLIAAEGTILPLGAAWIEEEQAYNFSLYAQDAETVIILLFGEDVAAAPLLEYPLDPRINKTWNVWHCRLGGPETERARYYAYRVDGLRLAGPGQWRAYDPEKVLLDPGAKEVFFPPAFDRKAAQTPGSNLGLAPLGVLPRRPTLVGPEYRQTPRQDPHSAVIYEMHVRGFTQSPTSGVSSGKRGTYGGVIDQIPHLKDLGVTIVELLPVQQFDPQEGNYWGYMPLNFFAPHHAYASDPGNAREEFPRWWTPCMARASRSYSTSFITTRRRGALEGRRIASVESTTRLTT
jgi:glycogen operon protein